MSSSVSAQGRDHDGFMLRLTGGFGYGALTSETRLGELRLDGAAVDFAVDVGGAIVENLNVHGRFAFASVVGPSVSVDGERLGTDEEASTSMMLLGPGLTYYIMPANVYLTAFGGIAFASISYENRLNERETGTSDVGIGLGFDLGWEFWIGRSWAIGPALRFMYISVPNGGDGPDETTSQGLAVGALFSATMQ